MISICAPESETTLNVALRKYREKVDGLATLFIPLQIWIKLSTITLNPLSLCQLRFPDIVTFFKLLISGFFSISRKYVKQSSMICQIGNLYQVLLFIPPPMI
jgi:hypothetical protein